MLNGRIGQVIGPFTVDEDLLQENGVIGKYTPGTTTVIYKLGIQAENGVRVEINGTPIRIGKTGIYELDNTISIKSLKFLDATDSDTLVDFIY